MFDARRLAALESKTRDVTHTWTPEFKGSTIAGVFTYTNQVGRAYVLGPLVFVQGVVAISAIGTAPTGVMSIAGLPLLVNTVLNGGVTFTYVSNFNYTAAALLLFGTIAAGGTAIDLKESFDNAAEANVPAANFTNVNCNLQFFGMYQKG